MKHRSSRRKEDEEVAAPRFVPLSPAESSLALKPILLVGGAFVVVLVIVVVIAKFVLPQAEVTTAQAKQKPQAKQIAPPRKTSVPSAQAIQAHTKEQVGTQKHALGSDEVRWLNQMNGVIEQPFHKPQMEQGLGAHGYGDMHFDDASRVYGLPEQPDLYGRMHTQMKQPKELQAGAGRSHMAKVPVGSLPGNPWLKEVEGRPSGKAEPPTHNVFLKTIDETKRMPQQSTDHVPVADKEDLTPALHGIFNRPIVDISQADVLRAVENSVRRD